MQNFIYFFIVLAMGLASDVSVYDAQEYYYKSAGPVFKSAAPWKFVFTSSDRFYRAPMYYINNPPSVTKVNVTYESGLVTVERKFITLTNGETKSVFVSKLRGPEVIINLNVYTSSGLCRSIKVAEGRVVSNKSKTEYKYTDICFKGVTRPCVLEVDLKDFICKGPSNVTQKNETLKTTTPLTNLENNYTTLVTNVSSSSHKNTKTSTNSSANNTGPSNVTQKNETLNTTTPITDLENNNTTFVSNVSSSSHENKKTSTNSSANNTDVKTKDDTLIIIVGSLSGINGILLAIIVIWKRCWSNHSPQGTPDLPTNQNHQPFYVNMLFRRECDAEIAEIDEHQYEEINPQVITEGG